MRRSLIILGASSRAAAFSAIHAGYSPYAIDLFADRDLAAVCPAVKIDRYPHDLPAALAAAPSTPWMFAGGIENHPRLVDQLALIRPLIGNCGATLRAVRNHSLVARNAREVGIESPDTILPGSQPTQREHQRQRAWLLKPRRGSGGSRIHFASPEQFAKIPPGAYLQRYVEGRALSALFLAARGQAILLGVTRQLLGKDFNLQEAFVYAGSIGPLTLSAIQMAQVQDLGNALAAQFGLVGLFNTDLVEAAGKIWLIEVNPRYSASVEVLERAASASFVSLHVAACQEETIPSISQSAPGKCFGKAIVYAKHNAPIGAEFEQLVADWNRPGELPLIADIPQPGAHFRPGQPVVTVFAASDSQSAVAAQLQSRVTAIHQLLSAVS
jgi:predicted ATP-grasp superfamily ATP-dependent carboligase